MANKHLEEFETQVYIRKIERKIERKKLKKKYKTNKIRGLWKKFHK